MVGTGKDQVHLLVVCTAERGLCGAFNSAIVRLAREHISRLLADGKQVKILCVGKKGFDQLKRLYRAADHRHHRVQGRSPALVRACREGRPTRCSRCSPRAPSTCATLFFSRFRSVISQIPTAQQIIPATIAAGRAPAEDSARRRGLRI